MYKLFGLLSLFLSFQYSLEGQTKERSDRVANYTMDVRLDPDQKEVQGRQILQWKNPSGDTIRELQYHLYLNAFKNSESTFMSERGILSLAARTQKEECSWGWIEILDLKDQDGNDLTSTMSYIQPDDGNIKDQTVLSVPLINPILPYQSTTIEMDWISHIPKTMARTGYNRDFYFMAQWFPKIGVYEPAGMRFAKTGQWNCHQYHSSGEYYANFGNYEVAITVPSSYVVGASGEVIKETKSENETTYTYRVNDVIDFAWTTSPHFEVIEEAYKGVKLRLLSYPYNIHFAKRYFKATKQAMAFFDEKIDPYPYPTLTIVNPPLHGIFCSAMEYPTLFTVIGNRLLPEKVRTPEIIAIHEYTHQYFMQMVATHEQEEAWMDEGMTNYYESRIMDLHYGKHTSSVDWMGITFGGMESNRNGFFGMPDPEIDPVTTFSWKFKNGSYHDLVYTKTALALQTLAGIVGLETMDEIMRTYFHRWKFKHPCGLDFIEVANDVVTKKHGDKFGDSLDWYFDQVLYGTDMCDYAVTQITNTPVNPPFGILGTDDICVPQSDNWEGNFSSTVRVQRLEDMMLPVDLKITFEDGSTLWKKWDGMARSKTFTIEGKQKIKSAFIDPDRKIYLDKNFTNNSFTVESQTTGIQKYTIQFMTWIQNSMQSISIFI